MSIISSSSSPSTISNTISTTRASTFGPIPLHHAVTIHPTKNNFIIWRAQLLPYLRSTKLMGYVDGTIAAPAKLVPSSTTAGADLGISRDVIPGHLTCQAYSLLKVFGCACWPHLRPYNKQKLSFRSKGCVFLGYSSLHKGYKCLDTDSGRVYISRDFIFDVNVFPFKRAPPNSSPTLQPTHNAPNLCTLHLGSSSTNLDNDHMHIYVPTNSLDAENLVSTSASELSLQSSASLSREAALDVS